MIRRREKKPKNTGRYRDEERGHRQQAGTTAYCTTCRKWYDPSKKRQFRKHDHLG
jgi:hypothetical protein